MDMLAAARLGDEIAHGFGVAAMVAGDAGLLLRPLGRVLLPYYLILAGYALHWGQVPWGSLASALNQTMKKPPSP